MDLLLISIYFLESWVSTTDVIIGSVLMSTTVVEAEVERLDSNLQQDRSMWASGEWLDSNHLILQQEGEGLMYLPNQEMSLGKLLLSEVVHKPVSTKLVWRLGQISLDTFYRSKIISHNQSIVTISRMLQWYHPLLLEKTCGRLHRVRHDCKCRLFLP